MIEMVIPSKTFLVGEYAVLQGAPALIAATNPSFEFLAEKSIDTFTSLFHIDSAASRWFEQSKVLLKNYKVELKDPHGGAGGFGASGAHFVFYHALATYLQSGRLQDNAQDVWQDYKACETSKGSGADVVAQTLGGITCFSTDPFEAKSYDWPFDETDFVILKTGNKIETHSHLNTKELPDLKELILASNAAVEGFFESNVEAFTASLAVFQKELIKIGLQDERTLSILDKLNSAPGALVTKGCGAMGADAVLVVYDLDFRGEFWKYIMDLRLPLVGTSLDLSPPMKLKVS